MIRAIYVLMLIVLAGALFAEERVSTGDKNVDALVREGNIFAFQLYAEIRQKRKNTVCSPYSVLESMALPFVGSRGATESQMARILRFKMSKSLIDEAFNRLNGRFENGGPYNMITGVWLQKGEIDSQYQKIILTSYGATLRQADFLSRPESARLDINSWMKGKTQGRITDLISPAGVSTGSRMVVLSGAYMRGKWSQTFNLQETKQAPFFSDRYTTGTVPTMFATGEYNYLHENNFSMIELPYEVKKAESATLSLFIILPHDTYGLSDVEKEIVPDRLERWVATMKRRLVVLKLPRFRVTDTFSLVDSLTQMGLTSPFGRDANFYGVRNTNDLTITQVFHKANYMIDEWGSDGGVSLEGPVVTSAVKQAVDFSVNHPFMFFVMDRASSCILLIGRISNPR